MKKEFEESVDKLLTNFSNEEIIEMIPNENNNIVLIKMLDKILKVSDNDTN